MLPIMKQPLEKKTSKKINRFVWLDGKIVRWEAATIHVATHGLHYATVVLEGIRVYNGKPFLLEEHIKRLLDSADSLQIKIPYTVDELFNTVHEIIAKNKMKNGYIRPLAWLGDESLELNSKKVSTHVAILAIPLNKIHEPSTLAAGLRVMVSSWARPAPHTTPIVAKSAAMYPVSLIAKHEAEQHGYNDALLLDYQGHLAEATSSNIFLIIDGDLHTPIPECSLNGFTRQVIMEEALNAKLCVIERSIHPDELKTAEEIFLTGIAYGILPVREVLNIGEFHHGPITQKLQERYKIITENL